MGSAISRAIALVVAVLAMILAAVGGLYLLDKANFATESFTTVATSCRAFDADARALFDKGEIEALSGTFAPGDRVHLAIDFTGAYFSWELTGVLGNLKKNDGSGTGAIFTKSIRSTTDIKFIPYYRSTTTTLHSGTVRGTGILDLEIDVTTAGAGALTINKASSAPLPAPPRVALARCNGAKTAQLL
jgi:hypothetical protein